MKEIEDFLLTIKDARERKGVSQRDMAKYLDISQPSYNSIESGKTSLKVEVLFQIATFLNIDLSLNTNLTKEYSEEENRAINKNLEELNENLEKNLEDLDEIRQQVKNINNRMTKLFDLFNATKKR